MSRAAALDLFAVAGEHAAVLTPRHLPDDLLADEARHLLRFCQDVVRDADEADLDDRHAARAILAYAGRAGLVPSFRHRAQQVAA